MLYSTYGFRQDVQLLLVLVVMHGFNIHILTVLLFKLILAGRVLDGQAV